MLKSRNDMARKFFPARRLTRQTMDCNANNITTKQLATIDSKEEGTYNEDWILRPTNRNTILVSEMKDTLGKTGLGARYGKHIFISDCHGHICETIRAYARNGLSRHGRRHWYLGSLFFWFWLMLGKVFFDVWHLRVVEQGRQAKFVQKFNDYQKYLNLSFYD